MKSGFVSISTKGLPHYIITLKNNKVDVDPTAQQILKNNPQVLIEEELYADSNFTKVEIDSIYKEWEYPLLNNGDKRRLIPSEYLQYASPQILEMENQKVDIIPYLRILVKAYYVLKEEISISELKGQEIYQESAKVFFENVTKIVFQNKDKRGMLGINAVNAKFDELLNNYNASV